jgi:hypothetical protein
MLIGKNKNFKGPRTHARIIKTIREEGYRSYKKMSFYTIEKMVKGLFNKNGIALFFHTDNNIYVRGLGTFKPTSKRRGKGLSRKIAKTKRRREADRIRQRRCLKRKKERESQNL